MFDIKLFIKRLYNKIYTPLLKKRMGHCGNNVFISPVDSVFYYPGLFIGNNVHIGYNADFISTRSRIIIGDHVVFAPHVSIRGGDHRTNVVGKFIDEVGDDCKSPENDADVIFEGDNWIGMNVTILKGVTVGRGSIIAAGTLVNKSVPAYSVVGGIPARILKMRFTEKEIEEHERILYNGKQPVSITDQFGS